MPVHAPVTRATHRALREAVLCLRDDPARRRFPPALHAGTPGAVHASVRLVGPAPDHGLRIDLAGALLQRALADTPTPLIWLTRPGGLSPHDLDLVWDAAVRHATVAVGRSDLSLIVVSRSGWVDPVTGVSREWRRLRRSPGRRTAPGP